MEWSISQGRSLLRVGAAPTPQVFYLELLAEVLHEAKYPVSNPSRASY